MVTSFPEECLLSNAGGKDLVPSITLLLFSNQSWVQQESQEMQFSHHLCWLDLYESQWDCIRGYDNGPM